MLQTIGKLRSGLTAALTVVLGLLAGSGCQDRHASINVRVAAGDELPPIVRIVTVVSKGDRMVTATIGSPAGMALIFPVDTRLNVSALPGGNVTVAATAFDTTQTMVARGSTTAILPADARIDVLLNCESLVCARKGADAGADGNAETPDGPDGGIADTAVVDPKCGNGHIDLGENCDIKLAPEFPGSCPTTCDDGIACTRDQKTGANCATSCEHVEITASVPGDGCCPAHGDHATDGDCSPSCGNERVDPGEACDTGIAAGPGACPDAASCSDQDPCTTDLLISEGTCSARCVHLPIPEAVTGDKCCALGANTNSDGDCPASCGNGVLEPGEQCDPGIPAGTGACPTAISCDDGIACTRDSVTGVGCDATCAHDVIDAPVPGDGCCPTAGLTANVDPDCPAVCGNGILEAGEACDKALAAPAFGACPSSCPASAVACTRTVLQGSSAACSASCLVLPFATCSSTVDGCCPTGCAAMADPDCPTSCGNGQLDPGETCDTAITAGPGACPQTCADGIACTDDLLVDALTCNAHCVFVPTTALRNGDGCCPAGAHAGVDTDCAATCGNGVVETPWESCDTGTAPASCSSACPPPETCATWKRNATNGCDGRCTRVPIMTCVSGDGCCAPGCNTRNDSDCAPRCGNGVVEAPETCDRGITVGHAGACAASCADADPCTQDFARGSADSCTRACSHVHITACGGGDRCCPAGCDGTTDSDCTPLCGDGQVQAGETCDPASTCPTSCPSDGDPCTIDQLYDSAGTCNSRCTHIPIIRCSAAQRDGCCPSECNTSSDSDC